MGRKSSNLDSVSENSSGEASAIDARRRSIFSVIMLRKSSAVKTGLVCEQRGMSEEVGDGRPQAFSSLRAQSVPRTRPLYDDKAIVAGRQLPGGRVPGMTVAYLEAPHTTTVLPHLPTLTIKPSGNRSQPCFDYSQRLKVVNKFSHGRWCQKRSDTKRKSREEKFKASFERRNAGLPTLTLYSQAYYRKRYSETSEQRE